MVIISQYFDCHWLHKLQSSKLLGYSSSKYIKNITLASFQMCLFHQITALSCLTSMWQMWSTEQDGVFPKKNVSSQEKKVKDWRRHELRQITVIFVMCCFVFLRFPLSYRLMSSIFEGCLSEGKQLTCPRGCTVRSTVCCLPF